MRELSHIYYEYSKYLNFNILKLSNLINKYINYLPITMAMRSIHFKNKKNFIHNKGKYIETLIKTNPINSVNNINSIKFFSSFIFNNYYIKKKDEFLYINNYKFKLEIIKQDPFCCLKKYSGCEYINKRREIETSLQLQSLLNFISSSQINPLKSYESN